MEGQGVPDHLVPEQHLREVASHGDLLYRIGERSSLDPEPHRPPRVVAGDEVDARADQLGDVRPRIY